MQVFQIHYKLDGEVKEFKTEATSIGAAFFKCTRANPGCILLKGYQHGRCGGKTNMPTWDLEYDPPSTVQPKKLSRQKMIQEELGI